MLFDDAQNSRRIVLAFFVQTFGVTQVIAGWTEALQLYDYYSHSQSF